MYKQIKPLLPTGKIQVTPEESEAVQKVLFGMGMNPNVSTEKPFIYWYSKKLVGFGRLECVFDKHENPLHIFTDYFTKTTE